MENNRLNFEKFASQYWEQEVMFFEENDNVMKTVVAPMTIRNRQFDKQYLKLKPLSEISDEDAIEVAKLQDIEFTDTREIRDYIKQQVRQDWVQYRTVDYLRSKGYLIGYNGLTPDQIIEYGWVKI